MSTQIIEDGSQTKVKSRRVLLARLPHFSHDRIVVRLIVVNHDRSTSISGVKMRNATNLAY